jgi:hypothetical protein
VLSASEPADTGVGGRSLNHSRTRNAGTKARMNSHSSKAVNYERILSSESASITKKGGIRNPTAVPMILAIESTAKATERYIMNYLHFLARTT